MYSTEFVSSEPTETNKRELAYTKIRVLSGIAMELATLVHEATAAEAEHQAQELKDLMDEDESRDAQT